MARAKSVHDQLLRQLMNRDFMLKQQIVYKSQHESMVSRRMEERELWEIEREKRMILEGKMGMDEAPYIADHPVFTVSKMTNAIFDEKRKWVEDKLKPKITKSFDFDQMKPRGDADEDLDSLIELDEEELERARKLWEIERQIEGGQIFTQEEYDKIKYEPPLIKQLRTVESVAEMYRLAEVIVGPIRAHHDKNHTRQG